jgi:cell division protein FtsI (penicillin-binding protein 3)
MTPAAPAKPRHCDHAMPLVERRRLLVMALCLGGFIVAEAGQLARLALSGAERPMLQPIEPVARSVARPDIVDRAGRLIATDIMQASVYADPVQIIDVDDAAEKLHKVLPDLETRPLREALANRARRFLWIRRGLTPEQEAAVRDLGLPGIDFRKEPRRVYPIGRNAAQTIGFVDIDNRGASGIERWIDANNLSETVDGPGRATAAPVVLTLDLAVQHALHQELTAALDLYRAEAAAGVVLDVSTGDLVAAVSLPDFMTGDAEASLAPAAIDRLTTGSYELGSVFKTLTLAGAQEAGLLTPGKLYDARSPIRLGGQMIDDFHPTRRQLDATDVFLHSSNIGAARMAAELGEVRLRSILARLGLTEPLTTEAGQGPRPLLPKDWQTLSTMTISFGHGISVPPLQFAAAMATLVGGHGRITPRLIQSSRDTAAADRAKSDTLDRAVMPSQTVAYIRDLLRQNVVRGTGQAADVPGYAVGGKTGTADILGENGYAGAGVLTSFLGIFPSQRPRYLTYVLLWKPKVTPASPGGTSAGLNAAPTTGRLIRRIGPLLGLMPEAG